MNTPPNSVPHEAGKVARVEHCDEMICFDRPACNLFLVRVGPGGICIASHKEKVHAEAMVEAINRSVTTLLQSERAKVLLEHINLIEFTKAPCYICGHNGPYYYQPKEHPCAKAFHEKSARAREEKNG